LALAPEHIVRVGSQTWCWWHHTPHATSCCAMPTTWSAPTRKCTRMGQASMRHPQSSPFIPLLMLRALVCAPAETLNQKKTGPITWPPTVQAHTCLSVSGVTRVASVKGANQHATPASPWSCHGSPEGQACAVRAGARPWWSRAGLNMALTALHATCCFMLRHARNLVQMQTGAIPGSRLSRSTGVWGGEGQQVDVRRPSGPR